MNDVTVRPIRWPAQIVLSRGTSAVDTPYHNCVCTADFGDLRPLKLFSGLDLGRPQGLCMQYSWRQVWSGSAWA